MLQATTRKEEATTKSVARLGWVQLQLLQLLLPMMMHSQLRGREAGYHTEYQRTDEGISHTVWTRLVRGCRATMVVLQHHQHYWCWLVVQRPAQPSTSAKRSHTAVAVVVVVAVVEGEAAAVQPCAESATKSY